MTEKNISGYEWQFFNTEDGFVVRRQLQGLKHECMYQFHMSPEKITLGEIFEVFNSTFTDEGYFLNET